MKKYIFVILSIVLLNSCVSKKSGRKANVIIVLDNIKIDNSLADADFSYFLTPKTLDCPSAPINLQVNPVLYRFSGNENIDTLKIVYKKNVVQKFLESSIKESDAINKLKEIEIPEKWRTGKFMNANKRIINFASDMEESDIIIADKKYNFLENFNNLYIVKSNENYKSILEKILCKNKGLNPKIYIFYKLKSFNAKKPIKIGGNDDEGTPNPCKTTTISAGFELKEKLVEVIDTKRSTTERIRLAKEVWNKYFDKDAYVEKLINIDDKNPTVWVRGEGKKYFIGRLATFKSIFDVNIIRIEYSKENPDKITGIQVIECHNASQKI